MPDEDKNFGGSLVLDFRKWWRHVKTIYSWLFLSRCTIAIFGGCTSVHFVGFRRKKAITTQQHAFGGNS